METLSNAASTVANFIYKAVTLPVRIGCFFIGKVVKAVSRVYNYLTGNSGQATQKQSPSTPIDDRQVIATSTSTKTQKITQSLPQVAAPRSINYQLLGTDQSGFSPIYDRKSQPGDLPLGSVNSGTKCVGRDGINKEYADALGIENNEHFEFAHFHDQLIQEVHKDQLVHITSTPGSIFPSKIQAATVLRDCLATHPNGYPNFRINDGTVFVEEFTDSACPYKNLNNRIMIYIISPNRLYYPDDQTFLNAVEKTAANTVRAFDEHNKWRISIGMPAIPVLRLCAFSSDSFADRPGQATSVDINQILAHIQSGTNYQLTKTSTIKVVQYSKAMEPIVPQDATNSSTDLTT